MIRALLIGWIMLIGISPEAMSVEQQGVDLASMAGWDIVVAPDAPPADAYAAQEFQTLFKAASGIELPIVTVHKGSGQNVFIGTSQMLSDAGLGFHEAVMGSEEFRIVARNDVIAIAGGQPRGTLYGVYTFLEDYVGVRFLTADHTHVPRLPPQEMVGPVERTYAPPLSFRWSYYGETNRSAMLAARLRINTISGDAKYGGTTGQSLINHTFGAQIPSSVYGRQHPDYFALRDGKRLADVSDDWTKGQPCLTQPDVLKIVTEAVLNDLKAHPDKENISVSQNDNTKNCQCPNCQAIDEREGTPMGSLLEFVNAVADRVATDHPNVKVGTLSYWYTRKPPKSIKPRPSVQIQLCSIECCMLHAINDLSCEKNVQFCKDMDEWSKLTENIFIWNYNTNFSNYLLPCPNLRVIEPNIRYFVDNGAKGIFMQAAGNSTGAELSDLRNYMMANLLWDPTRSGQKLMDEFLDLHYGPSAPPIRHFINTYHDHCASKEIHRNCFGSAAHYAIDQEISAAAMQAFNQALALTDNDVFRQRVEKASICAYRAAIEPAWTVRGGKLSAEQIDILRPLVKRFFELCTAFGVPMFSEGTTIAQAEQRLRTNLGIPESEEL